ncbi:MAG TPA: hypothetical protein VMT32_05050 [Bryobacteraceae bacterium]|nr:hypothetical protein [Bryobacteraceae bacterium]
MISADPVKQRAARIAVSFASVPLFVKKDLRKRPPGATSTIRLASAACGSVAKTVETCSGRSICW